MRARYVKFIIWVVALVLVWNLGQSYIVTNSLFMFAAAGVVPGTDIALGPDQVLLVLGLILFLATGLIFSANIYRGIGVIVARLRKTEQMAEQLVTTEVVAVEQSDAATEQPDEKSKKTKRLTARAAAKAAKPKTIVVIKHYRRPNKALMFLRVAFTAAQMSFAAKMVKLQPYIVRARALSGVVVGRVLSVVRRGMVSFAIFVGRAAVKLWRWAEPYLRRFDSWLEVQCHKFVAQARKNETVKITTRMFREMGKVVTTVRSELRAALSRVTEK